MLEGRGEIAEWLEDTVEHIGNEVLDGLREFAERLEGTVGAFLDEHCMPMTEALHFSENLGEAIDDHIDGEIDNIDEDELAKMKLDF